LFIVDAEQTLAFGASAFSVGETEKMAAITVFRNGLPTGTLSVNVRTAPGGTAVEGVDYLPVDVPLTFEAGEIVKTATVPIPATAVPRWGNGPVRLVLDGDPGVVVAPADVFLTIIDFQPDLVVTAVAAPQSALSGKLLNAPLGVRNTGQVMAPAFQVGIFLARDDGTPAAKLPGAGNLLLLAPVRALMPGEALQVGTMLDLKDALPAGNYFVSAVADFSQTVGESDENNNGRASAPSVLRISQNLGKLTSASASLSQGDGGPLPLVFRAAAVTDGCD